MDIGLYREDEQFLFSSPYMESYSSDSTSFETIEQNELFEEIRPMPQPPNEIFEWSDDMGKESSCDMDLLPLTSDDCQVEEALCISPSSKDDFHKMLGIQNWQPIWQPVLNTKVKKLPTSDGTITNDDDISISTQTANDHLQEILDLPEIVNTVNNLHSSANKSEANYDHRIAHCSDNILTNSDSSRRRVSESSDILNSSFNGSDITNFDIAEYIFEENKQSKQSMHVNQIFEPIIYKKESVVPIMPPQINKKQIDTPTRIVKAAVKKIDLRAQKYIIDKRDIKKSLSEDEDDVDIETVSEEESVPVLEAGNLTDLLEQFEANEVKNQEQNVDEKIIVQQPSQNILVEVKIEKEVASSHDLKASVEGEASKIKQEQTIKQEQSVCQVKSKQSICPVVTIKQERPLKKTNEVSHPEIKDHPKLTAAINKVSQEQLILNNKKVNTEPIVTPQEATTSSKAPSNRHIIDSLPQELINRIKESGKRKPITVIQAIPTNRKRSRVQELHKPVQNNSPSTVHLDHNYCSVGGGLGGVKKDSGFVSSEEDDRTIISRQPTVKNADGTLMVSLLKANTIRQVEPQRKKLNLEEYKKRRNGLIASNSNSQSCSPSTSTCSSPLPEDDHQKMLKHQEKLKKMAEEVLNAAPKSESKKIDNGKIRAPVLIPLSPSPVALSPQSISPLGPIPVEKLIKTEGTRADSLIKVDTAVKIDQPITVEKLIPIEAPNLPPNLERKVLVSFGVNTDFKIAKDEDPLAPVEKLEEIKPFLEKVSDKIKENSLIASVIENIPKIIDKNDKPDNSQNTNEETQYEHGENKQVLYLEIDRERCETKDAETQTNISLIEQSKRGRIRRRLSSSSSCSSYRSKQSSRRSRKSSDSSSSSRSSNSSRRSSLSSRSSEYSSRLSSYSRSRSRSPRYSRKQRNGSAEREHLNAVEERRIIYVGKIATSTTKDQLKKKFAKFGPINKISLHFRDVGENYGFVTFKYKGDAHQAYEHGNDDPSFPYYKISFGGRREFCKAAYSDLDNMREDSYYQSQSGGDSYDKLLKEALEKLKKRKL